MALLRLILLSCLCYHASAQNNWNCSNLLDWDFFNSTVTQNNLGGQGPNLKDKQEIRYSGVLTEGSHQADLVVTIVSRPGHGPYKVKNTTKNGLNGKFGQINILVRTKVLVRFQLGQPGTDVPVIIDAAEKIMFSVYDLDSGAVAGAHEYVRFTSGVASHGGCPEHDCRGLRSGW